MDYNYSLLPSRWTKCLNIHEGTATFTGIKETTPLGCGSKLYYLKIESIFLKKVVTQFLNKHIVIMSENIKMPSLGFNFERGGKQVLEEFQMDSNVFKNFGNSRQYLVTNNDGRIEINFYAIEFINDEIVPKYTLIKDLFGDLTVTVHVENR